MITVLEYFIKKIKGKEFNIDRNIKFSYIVSILLSMGVNLIRGNLKTLFVKKKGYSMFIGKKSKLKMKSKIILGSGINIGDFVVIDALSKEGVQIGSNVRIGDFTSIMCTGTIRDIGIGFKIGDNCGIAGNCFFGAAGGIEIGQDVIMGQNVRFHSENHNYSDLNTIIRLQGVTRKGIKVGNNCWIGSGVVFLDGVAIGDGCVIGANTLVNKSIPDNCIAVGNPVKVVKKRN